MEGESCSIYDGLLKVEKKVELCSLLWGKSLLKYCVMDREATKQISNEKGQWIRQKTRYCFISRKVTKKENGFENPPSLFNLFAGSAMIQLVNHTHTDTHTDTHSLLPSHLSTSLLSWQITIIVSLLTAQTLKRGQLKQNVTTRHTLVTCLFPYNFPPLFDSHPFFLPFWYRRANCTWSRVSEEGNCSAQFVTWHLSSHRQHYLPRLPWVG